MRSDKKIFIAFVLNLFFSIFEIVGGLITGSIAIVSDAIHDFGDAVSIGLSCIFERKSKNKPNKKYTYGYMRYSILGAFITNAILIVGSSIVIYNAIMRIINPVEINYNGMIIFAVVGVLINLVAVFFTRDGHSLNQKAVNLHMLEDALGWIVVLIGAVVIKFTNFVIIDPIMSILVALFILFHAINSLKEIVDLFLVKTPDDIDVDEIKNHLLEIDGVIDVHHIHLWSLDGNSCYATMHVVSDLCDLHELKHAIKEELEEHHISHVTIEFETSNEDCHEKECVVKECSCGHHHHHHHHHH